MVPVYFDTSIFLDIFKPDTPEAKRALRDFLAELQETKGRVHTSVITVQEVSVYSFLDDTPADDNYRRVNKIARVWNITEEIALTAAKMEARSMDYAKNYSQAENKQRRKWDCFHVATALTLGCGTFYTSDTKLTSERFRVSMRFAPPKAGRPMLPFGDSDLGIGPKSKTT